MSATAPITIKSEPEEEAGPSQPSKTEDILRIPSSTAPETNRDVNVAFVPLAGSPPTERPLRRECLNDNGDCRGMPALRVRYESSPETSHDGLLWDVDLQDAVRETILREVAKILPSQPQRKLPTIIFDELSKGNEPWGGPSIIELAFSDIESLESVLRGMNEIHVQRKEGDWTELKPYSCTGSLARDILRFDCNRLPLDLINIDQLFKALERMSARLGKLLGIGKLMVQSGEFGQLDLGVVRGYIQLHRDVMLLPWIKVIDLCPTHLEFEGVLYTLVFPECSDAAMMVFKSSDAAAEQRSAVPPAIASSSSEQPTTAGASINVEPAAATGESSHGAKRRRSSKE